MQSALSAPLAALVLLIAFLYSSVGFGGASGYLAAMSWFDIPANVAASSALTLNLFVSGIAFLNYRRHGHLQWGLLWPFVLTSIPAAFVGGALPIGQPVYRLLLAGVLLYIALRLLLASEARLRAKPLQPPSIPVALLSGAALGMLSGVIGIGGGIFLSPLIILAGWGNVKTAAASAGGFVWLNSLSGLVGRAWGGTFELGTFGLLLIPIGLIGSIAGSTLGARYLSGKAVRRLLGVVLLVGAGRIVLSGLFG